MEIQTKHRVELLNAKCEVVNRLYTLAKKSEYGDTDTDCCLEGMYAKVKLIQRLECHCFPTTVVTTEENTIFKGQIITSTTNYAEGLILYMYINGVLTSTQVVTSANLSKQFNFYELISNSGIDFEYHQVTEEGSETFDETVIAYYILNLPCTANVIIFEKREVKGGEITSVVELDDFFQNGVCEYTLTECHNCIEDSDLPKMYEVLKKLGK